jgi:hypothetical protein
MSTTNINPFPEPDSINKDLNIYVRNFIKEIFDKQGYIDFYSVMGHLEKAKEDKNHELSQIIAYYCTNIIMNNDKMSIKERQQLIHGLYREIYFTPVETKEPVDVV